MWRFGKLLPRASILTDKESTLMNILIDFTVYPLRDGTNLYTSGRVVGLSPITPSSGLIILLPNNITLTLADEFVYDAATERFLGHTYLWCAQHVTLEELEAAFARTQFCVSCKLQPRASSLSPTD